MDTFLGLLRRRPPAPGSSGPLKARPARCPLSSLSPRHCSARLVFPSQRGLNFGLQDVLRAHRPLPALLSHPSAVQPRSPHRTPPAPLPPLLSKALFRTRWQKEKKFKYKHCIFINFSVCLFVPFFCEMRAFVPPAPTRAHSADRSPGYSRRCGARPALRRVYAYEYVFKCHPHPPPPGPILWL